MEQFDQLAWIAAAFLFLAALSLGVPAFTALLQQMEVNVDNSQNEDYRQSIVLENMLSLKASEDELSATSQAYDYKRQRGLIPAEYFTNEDPSDEEIGFSRENGHCYIEGVPSLNGEDFGFYLNILVSSDSAGASDPRDIPCTSGTNVASAMRAPAILVRDANENPRLPVRIYVYSVDDGEGPNPGSGSGDSSNSGDSSGSGGETAEVDEGETRNLESLDGAISYLGRDEGTWSQKAHVRYYPAADAQNSMTGSAVGGTMSCGGQENTNIVSGVPLSELSGAANECTYSGTVQTSSGARKIAICSLINSETVEVGIGDTQTDGAQLCEEGGVQTDTIS